MTSIMERIAEAEAKADAILEEANRTARERITQARNDAEAALAAADAEEREKTARALVRAPLMITRPNPCRSPVLSTLPMTISGAEITMR